MDPTTLFMVVIAVGLAGALLQSWRTRDEHELRALELQVLLAEQRQRASLPAHVDRADSAAIEAWKRARLGPGAPSVRCPPSHPSSRSRSSARRAARLSR